MARHRRFPFMWKLILFYKKKKNKVDPTSAVLLTPIFENQEPNKFKKKKEITLSVHGKCFDHQRW